MLPCFVKSRFRFEHSSNSHSGKLSSYIASLYLPYFLSLPHSQNRHLPIYFIPNDLRTLAKTGGVYPLKANPRRNPGRSGTKSPRFSFLIASVARVFSQSRHPLPCITTTYFTPYYGG